MKFIIDVPEGTTLCPRCPWINNQHVCEYCCENGLCNRLDFNNLHIEEITDTI